MARIEDGFISLNGSEVKFAKEHCCLKCAYGMICSGPDSKTNTAEIHPTISQDPTDEEVAGNAPCLKLPTNIV